MEFWCVRCRKKVEVANPTPKQYGKRNAMTGACSCGTKVCKFVAKAK